MEELLKNCPKSKPETPSSACSVASRISGVSPLVMTGWPTTSSLPYASQQPSVTGYESGRRFIPDLDQLIAKFPEAQLTYTVAQDDEE